MTFGVVFASAETAAVCARARAVDTNVPFSCRRRRFEQSMISNGDSLAFSLHEIQDAYTAWRNIDDGIMFYMDFTFAAKEWFEAFQYELDQIEHFRCITFGPSYGRYPRVVRSYFPLLHAKYPPALLRHDVVEKELSHIYRARREQQQQQLEKKPTRLRKKRAESPDSRPATKRKRGEADTLGDVIERSKYDF